MATGRGFAKSCPTSGSRTGGPAFRIARHDHVLWSPDADLVAADLRGRARHMRAVLDGGPHPWSRRADQLHATLEFPAGVRMAENLARAQAFAEETGLVVPGRHTSVAWRRSWSRVAFEDLVAEIAVDHDREGVKFRIRAAHDHGDGAPGHAAFRPAEDEQDSPISGHDLLIAGGQEGWEDLKASLRDLQAVDAASDDPHATWEGRIAVGTATNFPDTETHVYSHPSMPIQEIAQHLVAWHAPTAARRRDARCGFETTTLMATSPRTSSATMAAAEKARADTCRERLRARLLEIGAPGRLVEALDDHRARSEG